MQTRLTEVDNAKQTAEEVSESLANQRLALERGLKEAQQRTADLEAESRMETARAEAAKADLSALREKYSVLKRRMAEAARKVTICTIVMQNVYFSRFFHHVRAHVPTVQCRFLGSHN